ncbi:MAG: UDP-N-acetylmuramoyl-L-alanyl-D-glutamate--2,6-diaminopimelate ligase [Bacillota bacterium]
MILKELVRDIDVLNIKGDDTVEIKGIAYDSRSVRPGFLFVAVKGLKADGHDYVDAAIQSGAPAVLVQRPVAVPPGVALVQTGDTRKGLGLVSARFYGHPSQRLRLIGVTGTNGKTTTTHLIAALYRAAGRKTGLVGTVGNYVGDRRLEVSHTTPESADLQKLFGLMVEEGVSVAVMEVSSHALALERVAGCEYDVAVFTNLTQDHLDFHRDMDDYFEAKSRLFRGVGGGVKKWPKYIVVNADDPYSAKIAAGDGVSLVSYGLSEGADFRATDIKVMGQGSSFNIESRAFGTVRLNMKLTGLFNVYNTLAAYAVGVTGGLSPSLVRDSLESVSGVPGRFQLVDCGQDFSVVVDYAHTPDGLENVLKAARAIASGKVIAVFGCGGDRDRTKRPVMGEIAGRYSDFPIITSDNPRTEDPEQIIRDVEEGLKKSARDGKYLVIPDRREAIRAAVGRAGSGDMVVIAGKGHEDYQIVGTVKHHFDDREEAEKALLSLKK